jgi:hypothetical protein
MDRASGNHARGALLALAIASRVHAIPYGGQIMRNIGLIAIVIVICGAAATTAQNCQENGPAGAGARDDHRLRRAV